MTKNILLTAFGIFEFYTAFYSFECLVFFKKLNLTNLNLKF